MTESIVTKQKIGVSILGTFHIGLRIPITEEDCEQCQKEQDKTDEAHNGL
jgi:hypothetical protein